jgi:UPF0042 nucleotide-binding protein
VFVEASPDILLRRFSVARRPHPLRAHHNLEDAISEERYALQGVRALADIVVDTTDLSPHDLRRQVLSLAGTEATQNDLLSLKVQSFSYFQGVPTTASLVFDVRFLPNPYFEESLRSMSGDDPKVRDWLGQFDEVHETIRRLSDLVNYLVPLYRRELKTDLTIGVGCTGGRHRSVYVAEQLAKATEDAGHTVVLEHRDKDRWRYS